MRRLFLTPLLLALLFTQAVSEIKNSTKKLHAYNFTFRPHFGLGTDGASHYGGRFLLNAGATSKYGLEFSKFKTDDDEFTSVGIILEQRLWNWFNMSIGTIGYLDYGQSNEKLFGLTESLGWEPDYYKPFKPFITYRNDNIFTQESRDSFHSISMGIGFEF